MDKRGGGSDVPRGGTLVSGGQPVGKTIAQATAFNVCGSVADHTVNKGR